MDKTPTKLTPITAGAHSYPASDVPEFVADVPAPIGRTSEMTLTLTVRDTLTGDISLRVLGFIPDSYAWGKIRPRITAILDEYAVDRAPSLRGAATKAVEVVDVDHKVYDVHVNATRSIMKADIQRGDIFKSVRDAAHALGLGPTSLSPYFAQAREAGKSVAYVRGVTLRYFKGD